MLISLAGALIVGACLGLLGSGGSILTVPILTYLLGEDVKVAIPESLAIVGLIALSGAVMHARHGRIQFGIALVFGAFGMFGAYVGAIASTFISASVQLALFALLMLIAAGMMLRRKPAVEKSLGAQPEPRSSRRWRLPADGFGVGAICGVVGIGGGFLIVPALHLRAGLPMRQAIATSLAIIVMNCIAGFGKHLHQLREMNLQVNWELIAIFGVVGIAGSYAGAAAAGRIDQATLRRIFAVFLLILGAFILIDRLARLV